MQLSKRWYLGWLLAFLAFPIGGLLATATVGKLDTVPQGVLGGLIAGAVLGLFQTLALRLRLTIHWEWLILTALGLAVGVGVGVAIFGVATTQEAILQRALPAGLALSIGQAFVLRRYRLLALAWIPTTTALYILAWFITTQVIGQSVNQGFIVFGASGAIVFQALTGLVLWLLWRGKSR